MKASAQSSSITRAVDFLPVIKVISCVSTSKTQTKNTDRWTQEGQQNRQSEPGLYLTLREGHKGSAIRNKCSQPWEWTVWQEYKREMVFELRSESFNCKALTLKLTYFLNQTNNTVVCSTDEACIGLNSDQGRMSPVLWALVRSCNEISSKLQLYTVNSSAVLEKKPTFYINAMIQDVYSFHIKPLCLYC